MTDLHDKARALLALREKATQGPWRDDADTYGDPDDVSVYAGEDFIANMGIPGGSVAFDVQPNNGRFIAAAHDMADTIRDLLAENERLKNALAERQAHWRDAVSRAEAAEARYKALCEAEPVACISPAELAHLKRARSAIVIPADAAVADDLILIPRPSMEGGK